MTTNITSRIAAIAAILGIHTADTTTASTTASVKETKKSPAPKPLTELPEGYISCSYRELLAEIKYDPDGNLPKEHNALYTPADGKKVYWFCSDKPVGIIDKNGRLVVIADNAFDQYKRSIAKKWAIERDWIPDYKYSQENNESVVGLAVMEAMMNGDPVENITKKCFKALDAENTHFDPAARKTECREEVCNDADRFMISMLFTGDVNTLHKLTALDGSLIPLPTIEALEQYTDHDLEQFKLISDLFKQVREEHTAASPEAWISAMTFALNMPTADAIRFIWGEKANGPKKYKACKTKYSRMKNEVFSWIVDAIEKMDDEKSKKMGKWSKVLTSIQQESTAREYLHVIKNFSLMKFDDDGIIEDAIEKMVVFNPAKAIKMFLDIIAQESSKSGVDYLTEYNNIVDATDTEISVVYTDNSRENSDIEQESVIITCLEDMPF